MLNIFYSQTISGCEEEIFNSLSKNRGEGINHIIFTPDRRNQQTELKMFEMLKDNCFFDVSVATLTRYTNQIISKHNVNFKVLSKPLGVAIIKKILNEHESEFKTFKKALKFNGFASTLFDTIAMFKSCGVTTNKLSLTTQNKSLNLKLEDIKLVYENYEKFLGEEWTDSFNKLDLLTKIIDKSDCENTHFYFLGFDDFTPQMYSVIAKLSKLGLSCNVATAVSYIDGINNKNIYLNNVYLNLLSLAQINAIKVNKIYCSLKLNNTFSFLSKNLLGYSNNKFKNENLISTYKFNNVADEVKFITKAIVNLCLKHNLSFNDFAIIVSDLGSYKKVIKQEFEKNLITYFFDESEKISDNLVLRFYFDLFNLINNNFLKVDVFNFLFSYTSLNREQIFNYENLVNLSGLNYSKILEPVEYLDYSNCTEVINKLKELKSFYSNLKQTKTFNQIVELLLGFANNFGFNDFINLKNQEYVSSNNVIEHRKLNQVVNKVNKGLSELTQVLSNYTVTFSNAFNIIKAFFENTTVVVPPIINNSVFVADAITSFVPRKKYAFVLGAQDGCFPTIQTDLGIISDTDINTLKNDFSLTPTINIINKRNKFKVFETLLNFDNLIISYVCQNSKGETVLPCEAIKNITDFFEPKVEIKNGSLLQQVTEFDTTSNNIIYNNVTLPYLKENLIQSVKFKEIEANNSEFNKSFASLFESYNKVTGVASELINLNNFVNETKKLNNLDKLFFNKDFLSISQFEDYFGCAYKHFIDYGLKLKSETSAEFDAREIGNILHEYVKIMLPVIDEKQLVTDAIKVINEHGIKVLEQILKNNKYVHLISNPQNANDIKSLYNEITRINNALLNERKVSKFKIDKKHLEMPFLETTNIKCGNGYLKIKGVIDRVDVLDDEFRIIDYKTGKSEFSDFSDIKYGKKIQLIVYAGIAKQKLKLNPVGAFYLPLKNDFIKGDKNELFKLTGVVKDSLKTIINMDSGLSEPNKSSSVINVKTDKAGNLKGGLRVSETEFEQIFNYVSSLIAKAVVELENGNIEPKPLITNNSLTCDYCPYIGLCGFSQNLGNSYNEAKKIKTIKELLDEWN